MVGRIVAAVDLPVTMDFEAGYGDAGETARRAIEMGVVGGNLEDQMKPLDEAVAAVEAVLARRPGRRDRLRAQRPHRRLRARAARDADRGELVEEAIRRGRAFLEAGAPVVFVPGVGRPRGDRGARRRARPAEAQRHQRAGRSLPVRELQELGVARVSTGPFTQRVALTALQDATAGLVAGGVLPAGHPPPQLTRPVARGRSGYAAARTPPAAPPRIRDGRQRGRLGGGRSGAGNRPRPASSAGQKSVAQEERRAFHEHGRGEHPGPDGHAVLDATWASGVRASW